MERRWSGDEVAREYEWSGDGVNAMERWSGSGVTNTDGVATKWLRVRVSREITFLGMGVTKKTVDCL